MARILIVDDDPLFAELTARRLTGSGHEVEVRTDANGVLTDVRHGGYHILLIDVVMPGISGAQLMDALAARDRGSTKLVFLSSKDPQELAALTATHKADGYITKSASKTELASKIELILLRGNSGAPKT